MASWKNYISPSNISEYIKDTDFPASKQDIINQVEDSDAPDQLVQMLEKLPNKVYESLGDLIANASKVMA